MIVAGIDQREVRHAVGDDLDLRGVDAIRPGQHARRGARHDHRRGGRVDERAEDRPLVGGRLAQDRVQRGDRRGVEGVDEIEDRGAVDAAPDAVLVLDRHDVGASRDVAGDPGVVTRLVATDPVVDLGRIREVRARSVEGDDLALPGGARESLGERGDAAVARRVGGGEHGAGDDVAPSGLRRGRVERTRATAAPRGGRGRPGRGRPGTGVSAARPGGRAAMPSRLRSRARREGPWGSARSRTRRARRR